MFSSRMRIYSLLIVVANVELRYSNTYYIIINRFVSIFIRNPPLFCMPLYNAWIPLLALHLVWSTIEHNVQYIVVIIAQIAQYSAIQQHSYFCKLWYDLLLTNQSNRAALQSLVRTNSPEIYRILETITLAIVLQLCHLAKHLSYYPN